MNKFRQKLKRVTQQKILRAFADQTKAHEKGCRHTRRALIWQGILNEPLITMVVMLPFILVKELGVSNFAIAVFTAIKPTMALLSMYCVSWVVGRGDRLIRHLVFTGILARLPFFFFPWIQDPSWLIAATAFYMMLYRGSLPAWIEVLRHRLPQKTRSQVFSLSSVLGYVEGFALSFVIGGFLRGYPKYWPWLFVVSAAFGLLAVYWQWKIPIKTTLGVPAPFNIKRKEGLTSWLLKPWKQAFHLLKMRRDYLDFQLGFALCGSAVMMIYAVKPHFFVDKLQVSYTEIALAVSFFKGLGYTLSSASWSKMLDGGPQYFFKTSAKVFLVVCAMPIFILFSIYWVGFLYLAFFAYGVGLAGNHLVWHLSAPAFSQEEDSCLYSSINVMAVGIRGIIFPALGAYLFYFIGSEGVMILASILCLLGAIWMFKRGSSWQAS